VLNATCTFPPVRREALADRVGVKDPAADPVAAGRPKLRAA
jgi:hypothetical protein